MNGKIITEQQLTQTAIHSMLSKEARTRFQKLTKRLNVTTKPLKGLFGKEEP